MVRIILLLASAVAVFAQPAQTPAADPIRIMIVTGGHGYYPSVYKLFEYPDFRPVVEPHPTGDRGDARKRCDVLVLYDMVEDDVIGEAGKQNLRNFIEAGKGVVIFHHAVLNYSNWAWWHDEVIGMGRKPAAERPQPGYTDNVDLTIEPVGKHPILNGVGPFRMVDETYRGFWYSPNTTLLLKTNSPTTEGPLAWIGPNKKARVVAIMLGHTTKGHLNPDFQHFFRNAVLWAAGRLN